MAVTDKQEGGSVAAAVTVDETSYVDWPAILAGTVLASAIAFLLLTFGSAVGLTLTSAYEGTGMSLLWFSIAAALWLLWVQISAYLVGGYLTGRLRRRKYDATEHEADIRDGSHGLVVWALGVLVSAVIAFSGLTAVVSAGTSAASTAAKAAEEAVDRNAVLLDRFLRPRSPGGEPVPAEAREEIGRGLVSALSDGSLSDADKQYLANTVAARTGLDQGQAEQRVNALWAEAQKLETQAREAAERARKLGVVIAFLTAASLFIGAVAAYYGAVLGGNHRDNQTVFGDWVKPW